VVVVAVLVELPAEQCLHGMTPHAAVLQVLALVLQWHGRKSAQLVPPWCCFEVRNGSLLKYQAGPAPIE
jgi:hypothetical protein